MRDLQNLLIRFEEDLQRLDAFLTDPMADLNRVQSLDHWESTVYEREYLPRLALAGMSDNPDLVRQNTADLHIHTPWSDGDDLDRVLEQALVMRLDVIAITDHDAIEGAFEARRRIHERRWPLAVIPGVEVSSADGHIGALFVMKTFPIGLGAEETVRLIHEAGGIAVAHHPYVPRSIERILRIKLGCGDLIRTIPFDAVECTNAVPGRGVNYNIATIEAIRKHNIVIAVTGSSDAHHAAFVGKGKTYFAGNQGVESLRLALLHGFTKGAEGYWKTQEKITYYRHLMTSIARNRITRFGSVN